MKNYPKHDGPMASTQASVKPTGSKPTPYKSGAKSGSGGVRKDPDGGMPMSQPKGQTY